MLHNYMDFDDLKDYVKISYELTQDGLVISKGALPEFLWHHGEKQPERSMFQRMGNVI